MYWSVSYLNGSGSKVTIATGLGNPGNGTSITNFSATTLIRNELYVPFTIVPSATSPVVIDIYTIIKGGNTNNKTVTLYFNQFAYSFVRTTIAFQGVTGVTGVTGYTGWSGNTGNTGPTGKIGRAHV